MSAACLSKRKGFSWVDILAILAILAIVAAIFVPHLTGSNDTAKAKVNNHNKAIINAAVDRWYVEKGAWPAEDLSELSSDPTYFPNGMPTNPVDSSTYRLNPTTHYVD